MDSHHAAFEQWRSDFPNGGVEDAFCGGVDAARTDEAGAAAVLRELRGTLGLAMGGSVTREVMKIGVERHRLKQELKRLQDSTGNPVEGAPGVAHQQTPAGSRPPEVHRGPAGEGISATFRGSVLQAGELPDEAEDGTPAPTVRGLVLECENSDVLRALATLVSQGERMFRLEVL